LLWKQQTAQTNIRKQFLHPINICIT
jgi:hypothetical protein